MKHALPLLHVKNKKLYDFFVNVALLVLQKYWVLQKMKPKMNLNLDLLDNISHGMGHFGDAVSAMDVSVMDFRLTLLLPNFWTYPRCQPCSIALGKFLLLVFMTKVAKKTCQTSKEKAYLAFDCKYVSWSLPLSKLQHPAPPNACTRSPRGNLWYPAVGSGVRTPGSICWQGIGSIDSYIDRQQTERKNEYTLKLAVKCNQNIYAKAEAIIAAQA